MSADSKTADEELRLLEIELKREEIRQLKSNFRFKWLTPASIALPLIGGALLYIIAEIKEYSDAHQALAGKKVLEAKISNLERQKDSLNLEIPALLGLKNHYSAEAKKLQGSANKLKVVIKERQQKIDQLYLRGYYSAQEGIYALDHARKTKNLDKKTSENLRQQIRSNLPEASEAISTLVSSYHFYQDMSGVTNKVLEEFTGLLKEITPSEDALKLQWHPEGLFLSGRPIMATIETTPKKYYDINLGRYLNQAEVAKIQ